MTRWEDWLAFTDSTPRSGPERVLGDSGAPSPPCCLGRALPGEVVWGCCAHTGVRPVPAVVWAGHICTWRDTLLTPVVLSPQVLRLWDVLHQAHPPARGHHGHRQLLHLPNEQEKGKWHARAAAPLHSRAPAPGPGPGVSRDCLSGSAVVRPGDRVSVACWAGAGRLCACAAASIFSRPCGQRPGHSNQGGRPQGGARDRGRTSAGFGSSEGGRGRPSSSAALLFGLDLASSFHLRCTFCVLGLSVSPGCSLPAVESGPLLSLGGHRQPGSERRPICKPELASRPPRTPAQGQRGLVGLAASGGAAQCHGKGLTWTDQVPRGKGKVTPSGTENRDIGDRNPQPVLLSVSLAHGTDF